MSTYKSLESNISKKLTIINSKTMNTQIYKERKSKIENVKISLKNKFIGIDSVIDRLIDTISLWYIAPELQTKPLIISLWGMTGVGKTDLIHKLVDEIDFHDFFVEIQMNNKTSNQFFSQTIIGNINKLNNEKPSILLLDEFHQYNTIDNNGNDIYHQIYGDLWSFISDGKLNHDDFKKQEILKILHDKHYIITDNTKMSYYNAEQIKFNTNSKLSELDIMNLSNDERYMLLLNAINDSTLNKPKQYDKMLIIISGNIDEAFTMSTIADNSDIDADIYHEISNDISIPDIKTALLKRFKPEQISRLGNNYIIYNSLSKQNYVDIIKFYCGKIINNIKIKFDLNIELDHSIYDIIYKNGVYPTQGVRPVLSTISQILECNIPLFIFNCIEQNIQNIKIEFIDNKLISNINNIIIEKSVILDLTNIQNQKNEDLLSLVTVHEIGHALVYASLFNVAPAQININTTNSNIDGFITQHNMILNKEILKNIVCVQLSGFVAEEIVFGENFRSDRCQQDLINASNLISKYIRKLGMSNSISIINNPSLLNDNINNTNIEKSNSIMETMLTKEKNRSIKILNKHIHLLKKLIDHAITNKEMTISNFVNICRENGLIIDIINNDNIICHTYKDKLNIFLKTKN